MDQKPQWTTKKVIIKKEKDVKRFELYLKPSREKAVIDPKSNPSKVAKRNPKVKRQRFGPHKARRGLRSRGRG